MMDVINREDAEPFVAPDGAIIRELAASRNSCARQLSLAEAILPPGEALVEHFHRTSEELYYLLRGTGTVILDGEDRAVGPGDAVVIPTGCRHTLVNDGTEDIVLLACCAPEWRADDQVLLDEDTTAGGP
jgi:mannose-6-phosphate isomerase-like protein (cupin superfamily)